MLEKLIKKYVGGITMYDVDSFAKENNIFLEQEEVEKVFLLIKEKWSIILNKDIDQVMEEVKLIIREENHSKVRDLLLFYKRKYDNYL